MRTDDVDRDLIQRLRSGDAAAVPDLVAAFGARVEHLAFRYLKNREDAEEVAQDVFLRVTRAVDRFRGEAALASWIYRITFNTAISRLRRRRAMGIPDAPSGGAGGENPDAVSMTAEVADWTSMADEHYLRGQLRTRLNAVMRSLPAMYRAPVMLRDLQGRSTAEASAVLGITSQTLKSRLHRGRAMMRPRLAVFWGGLTLHSRVTSRRGGAGSGAALHRARATSRPGRVRLARAVTVASSLPRRAESA